MGCARHSPRADLELREVVACGSCFEADSTGTLVGDAAALRGIMELRDRPTVLRELAPPGHRSSTVYGLHVDERRGITATAADENAPRRYRSDTGLTIFLGAMPAKQSTVLDARAFDRTLRRIADEIVELNNGTDDLVIVGIQRRGAQLAARIVSTISEREKATVPQGALDITLYRDDLQTIGPRPVVGQTQIPVDIDGQVVVIVDDVLYTGRTVRAALDELADFGRPRRIALAVLIDRGGRELPIQPDIVGKTISAEPSQRVDVLVEELDGKNGAVIAEREAT